MIKFEPQNVLDLLAQGLSHESVDNSLPDFLSAAVFYYRAMNLGSSVGKSWLEALYAKGVVSEEEVERAERTTHRYVAATMPTPAQPKVLIIEDGVETLTVMAYMLRQAGYEPILAVDGLDALEKTLAHPEIACMIIDLQMPNINGFEFISLIRAQKAFIDVPIIIVTAHSDPKLIAQGQKLGVNGWIKKPVRKDVLVGNVKRAIKPKAA